VEKYRNPRATEGESIFNATWEFFSYFIVRTSCIRWDDDEGHLVL